MADGSRLCSVWLGSETGILKGVSVARKLALNFCDPAQLGRLDRQQEVRALSWADPEQSQVLVGRADGTVLTFSTDRGAFTGARRCGGAAEGCFAGLAALRGGALVSCVERGAVRVWGHEGSEPVTQLDAGPSVSRMTQSPVHAHRLATGGKENALRMWDLHRPEVAVFTAKNLRDDWLDLRRPHWVRDVAFMPDSDKLVTCTGYHQVHVYDPSSPQRRPVLEAEYGEYPLTALSLPASGNTVVVGNTHGQIALLDLRKGLVRGTLKGLSGGVRGLQCHPSQPVVASCGLDRFLRIHSLEDRRLLHKVYLKSRLNCLLLASRDLEDAGGLSGEAGTKVVKEEEGSDDEVWDAMERVGEGSKRRTPEEEEEATTTTTTTTTKKKKRKRD